MSWTHSTQYGGNMDPKAMPFDGKRMFYGGFKAMVDL